MGRFAQKMESIESNLGTHIDSVDRKMETALSRIEKKVDEICTDIKETKRSIGTLEVQLARLETRVEERTLRVIHVDREEKAVQ